MEFDWQDKVDVLLNERRPDRYTPGVDDEWLDIVAQEVAELIPERDARAIAARLRVGRREGDKTRQTNKLLREIHQSGELPLDWMETMNLPLAAGKERVALRACSPEDFEEFAIVERKNAGRDFAQRNATCEAAEWIAEHMRGNGWDFGHEVSL